ncbi:unnamed protein product [Trichobilharzia szidati]|nr:unnamed protein product [Trichobilharzia szidati]
MIRTVSDLFRYQGLAFALFFTLSAIMADLLCYFFLPTTLTYLLGSSFVWIQLVWQTDRGFYIPTVALCCMFPYFEFVARFRGPKNFPFGIDLCRPFAAHCIGYPVVTLGFSLKSTISHHFRLRRKRWVAAQNTTFFSILERALPKELWFYLKSDSNSKSKNPNVLCDNNNCPTLAISSTPTVPNSTSTGHIVAEASNAVSLIHSKDKDNHCITNTNRKNISVHHSRTTITTTTTTTTTTTRITNSSTAHRSNCTDVAICSTGKNISQEHTFQLKVGDQNDNYASAASALAVKSDSYTKILASAENTVVKLSSHDIHQESCIQKENVGKEEKLVSKKSPSSIKSVTSSSSASTCSNSSMPKSSSGVNNPTSNKTKSTNTKSSGVKQKTKTTSGTAMNSTAVSGAACGGNGSGGGGKPNASASNPSSSTGCKNSGKNSNKDEYTLKLEAEAKHLKSEIQSLRSSEVQLRSQVQQLLSIERTYQSESTQAQQEYESLQVKYNQLTQRLENEPFSLISQLHKLTNLIEMDKQELLFCYCILLIYLKFSIHLLCTEDIAAPSVGV